MKLANIIAEQVIPFGARTLVFIPSDRRDQFQDMCEFGPDSEEYFETKEEFLEAHPNSFLYVVGHSNPEGDYRSMQSGYYDEPSLDFKIWNTSTGKLFWEEFMGDEGFYQLPNNTFKQMQSVFVRARDMNHLKSLILSDTKTNKPKPVL